MQTENAINSTSIVHSPMEIDAIGEVLNISMGAAATAVSSMLDKQVIITTPRVGVEKLESIDYGTLEPALLVKIVYTEGLEGANVMVFRQQDMQLILNQLMGIEESPSENFVFDELSMSAACEVMNQMMGAAATALSDFLGKPINISTPTATVMSDRYTFMDAVGLSGQDDIVSVLFSMDIQGVMSSEFVSVLPCNLAKMIVGNFIPETSEKEAAPQQPMAQPQQPMAQPQQPVAQPQQPMAQPQQPMAQPQQPMAQPQQPMAQPQQPMAQPQMQPMAQPQMQPPYYPPYPAQQPGYPPYYYYGQPPMSPYGVPPQQPDASQPPVNVQSVQFPEFNKQATVPNGAPIMGGNADLLMNVPLNVAIEIGQTKRKIKDILGFAQGTVIELDKQAGAPIDIVVNGQLIAHGDVVVIDDNFGVRITEIVGTKELLNSLEKEMQ
ncbi:MAG: flagellar motor switch phosphatase FliY [Oscillospiraceae bacterium]|nr:flagellar motor switch phosphatase FliY [Oscillospiraceae bacterium]